MVFICLGCGAQYLDPGELFECAQRHLTQNIQQLPNASLLTRAIRAAAQHIKLMKEEVAQ